MDKASEDHWRELSEEILTDVKEWRKNHPKATLREIEDEIHARMEVPRFWRVEEEKVTIESKCPSICIERSIATKKRLWRYFYCFYKEGIWRLQTEEH